MILHRLAGVRRRGTREASDTEAFVTQDNLGRPAGTAWSTVERSTSSSSEPSYRDYQKVVKFIAVWVVAVILTVFLIDAPQVDPIWQHPDYRTTLGYTYSLALLYLPLAFLVYWYIRNRDGLELRALMGALTRITALSALTWILLDIFFANALFWFPDAGAHLQLTLVPGYLWSGECSTIWTLWRFPACYFPRSIPLEEILFYLGGAALLAMMYMWASEDFYSEYTLSRPEYTEQAKKAGPLVQWNLRLVAIGIGIAILGILIKKFGWWHTYQDGWPYYLFAELLIVFVPLSALYSRVHAFTNTRAFVFVMLVHILVSVVWETTLALPYGWWNYRADATMGIFVAAWSHLAIEAVGLWLSVGWASMFIYESMKIKVVTGKSWPEVLFG
jgi:hypothetical protein